MTEETVEIIRQRLANYDPSEDEATDWMLANAPRDLKTLLGVIDELRKPSQPKASADDCVSRTVKETLQALKDQNPEALTADDLDEAIIGVALRCGQPALAVYDVEKCVELLVRRDGITEEAAREHVEFNRVGAWVGENTPLWLYR